MIEELQKLIASLRLNSGASKQSLDALSSAMSFPEDYLDLLRISNGAEGNLGPSSRSYIIIWPAEEVIKANREYGVCDDYPELVLFGKNAATAAYAFDTRFNPMPVIEADLIDPEYREKVGNDFLDFLKRFASS